jgi:hypothetical protein
MATPCGRIGNYLGEVTARNRAPEIFVDVQMHGIIEPIADAI